jgi:hypothetical protein
MIDYPVLRPAARGGRPDIPALTGLRLFAAFLGYGCAHRRPRRGTLKRHVVCRAHELPAAAGCCNIGRRTWDDR